METDILRLTLVQPDIIWEDSPANLARYTQLLQQVQTDVLVLPEMFNTGFTMNAASVAQPMNGAAVTWLLQTAQQLQCAVTGSVVIEENGLYYNRMIWAQPNGALHTYNKRHLFRMGGEDKVFSPGNHTTIVNYKGWRIMLQVCYDLRFPVWSRNNRQNPYHLLLYIANWPEVRNYPWRQLLKARAIENQCYVAGVNRIGYDGNKIYHSGNSTLLNYRGEELWTQAHLPAVTTFGISKQMLEEFRTQFPAWMDADDFSVQP